MAEKKPRIWLKKTEIQKKQEILEHFLCKEIRRLEKRIIFLQKLIPIQELVVEKYRKIFLISKIEICEEKIAEVKSETEKTQKEIKNTERKIKNRRRNIEKRLNERIEKEQNKFLTIEEVMSSIKQGEWGT